MFRFVKIVMWFNLLPRGYVLYWYVLCTYISAYYCQAGVGLSSCADNDLYKLNNVIDVLRKSKTQSNILL